jgi:hypothetical protein
LNSLWLFSQWNSKPTQINELKQLKLAANTDSMLRIDYLISLKFHELINIHRKINNTHELMWDDTLWLVSRNHNLWMEKANHLGHYQTNDSPFFTGKTPGERHLFTINSNQFSDWCGENCLYIFTAHLKIGSDTAYINSVANSIFQTWKTSDGHNRNMLSDRASRHGTSVYHAKDGRIWATDLFAFRKWNNLPSLNNPKESNEVSKNTTEQKITVNRIKKDLKKSVKKTSFTQQLNNLAQETLNNLRIFEKENPNFSEHVTVKSIRFKLQKFPYYSKKHKIELKLNSVTHILSFSEDDYKKWLEQFSDSQNGYSFKLVRLHKKNELILAECRLIK